MPKKKKRQGKRDLNQFNVNNIILIQDQTHHHRRRHVHHHALLAPVRQA